MSRWSRKGSLPIVIECSGLCEINANKNPTIKLVERRHNIHIVLSMFWVIK